jgi:hypothetical protein
MLCAAPSAVRLQMGDRVAHAGVFRERDAGGELSAIERGVNVEACTLEPCHLLEACAIERHKASVAQ